MGMVREVEAKPETIVIELRLIQKNKKQNDSYGEYDDYECLQDTKIYHDNPSAKCVRKTVTMPSNYTDLQTRFSTAFPWHDNVVIVERECGSQVLPNESCFKAGEIIVFREYSEGGKFCVTGLPENWETQVYRPELLKQNLGIQNTIRLNVARCNI
mmetsp:Transcript_8863/g.10276  ORF Transcript_8863/g.10276 Transcript_8863/m.10276 type:complete len:156 (-) Transcript_8863:203-670(-)